MKNPIEETNQLQQKYWRRFLLAFFVSQLLLIARHIFGTVFREQELNSSPLGILVLAASIVLLAVMFYIIVRLARLKGVINADPRLKEALVDDDLRQLNIANSWKFGFIGAVVTPFAFALIPQLHMNNDPLLVAFATPATGTGAFLLSLYLRNN